MKLLQFNTIDLGLLTLPIDSILFLVSDANDKVVLHLKNGHVFNTTDGYNVVTRELYRLNLLTMESLK